MMRVFLMAVAVAALSAIVSAEPIVEIQSPAGAGAAEPFLFATKNALLMSWLEPIAKSNRVALRFARWSGRKWSEPRTIVESDDLFVNWADFPSIVEDAKGVLFAHWLQKSASSTYAYDVQMAISMDGGRTWSKPFALNRDGRKTEHGFASLAPLPRGGVGVTWLDGRNMPEGKEEGEMSIRYATVDARAQVHDDAALDTRTCECCATGMTMASKGAVVVYRDRSNDDIRDIAIVRRAGSRWTPPRLIRCDGWKINGCPVNGPQIDAIGDHAAVAWFTGADNKGRVYVAFSNDAGVTFTDAVAIDDANPAGRVDIVMLDTTTALVTWLEQIGPGAEIRARRVRSNGQIEPAIKVADSSAARAAGFPRIARMGREIYFAWTEQSATMKRIHVASGTFQ
ncbi:MAG TPA: sialidase family protein [Thermoanaerobaculia bacterium]|nr:sialidase family protein [Thermoanaerobaculia bacterium]